MNRSAVKLMLVAPAWGGSKNKRNKRHRPNKTRIRKKVAPAKQQQERGLKIRVFNRDQGRESDNRKGAWIEEQCGCEFLIGTLIRVAPL